MTLICADKAQISPLINTDKYSEASRKQKAKPLQYRGTEQAEATKIKTLTTEAPRHQDHGERLKNSFESLNGEHFPSSNEGFTGFITTEEN